METFEIRRVVEVRTRGRLCVAAAAAVNELSCLIQWLFVVSCARVRDCDCVVMVVMVMQHREICHTAGTTPQQDAPQSHVAARPPPVSRQAVRNGGTRP